jgi:hypothetical protein
MQHTDNPSVRRDEFAIKQETEVTWWSCRDPPSSFLQEYEEVGYQESQEGAREIGKESSESSSQEWCSGAKADERLVTLILPSHIYFID